MKTPTVIVKQNEQAPEPAEVIASAIVEIANGMKKLNSTRLKRRAIVTLIHENSKIGRGDIEIVLNNLEALEQTWLKPKP